MPDADRILGYVHARYRRRKRIQQGSRAVMTLLIVTVASVAVINNLRSPSAVRTTVSDGGSHRGSTAVPTSRHETTKTTTGSGLQATDTTPTSAANWHANVGGIATPDRIRPGSTVSVSGRVCGIPGWICTGPGIVILQAFDQRSTASAPISAVSNPAGFIATTYDAAGYFSVRVALSPKITPGPQSLQIRVAPLNTPLGPAAGAELGGQAANVQYTVVS
jgi:hypothetical protein